ncbi:MAG: hypothetical protein AB1649_27155 [Chloroflexota bacterium]
MKLRFTEKSVPLLFAILTILGYGLLLPLTGFYWDDWPFAWIAKFLGPYEFIPAFAPFRPFLGPIFFATTSLIPPVPLYWQIFALIIRFIIGLSAWWSFKQIWAERKGLALTAALFILVFPGYSQHWVAFTHINQELIPFIFYLLSFGFTFKAVRSQDPRHTIIAVLLQICGIFPTEYFFGIEGIRALFLLSFFPGNLPERITQTLKHWWPYLLIWILNAAWLFYYYRFGPYNSYEVTAAQSLTLSTLFTELADSLWKTGFYIWTQVLVLTFSSITAPASLLTLGLVVVSFAVLALWLRAQQDSETSSFSFHPSSLISIGILAIFLGRLPSLAAGLPLTLQSSYDRFMVSMMIGGSLFVLGLIELIFGNSKYKVYVIALIVALGIGQQFFNANIFRRDWTQQREIYWQLAWRIPALEENTVILTDQMPIDYETDISFTAPVNWLYAEDFTRGDLPYLMLYTEKRLGGGTLPSLEPNTTISFPYRTVTFHGNTSQAIVIFMPRNGCLRVLDPERDHAEIYNKQQQVLVDAIPLSDVTRIVFETSSPAQPDFIEEPEHGWCYTFAKAELAFQMDDWEQVVRLGNEAISLGYSPADSNEWLTFIEANALTGNIEAAREMSMQMIDADAHTKKSLCILWERIQANGVVSGQSNDPAGSEEEIQEALSEFGCSP